MNVLRRLTFAALTQLAVLPLAAQQQCPAMSPGSLPLKYVGGATVPGITPCDLMTRLYVYADDSMLGREIGSEAHLRATAYIEREVRRLGLKPAGDSGGYFQNLPVMMRRFDSASSVTAGLIDYRGNRDFVAANTGRLHQLTNVAVVFAGAILDTLATLPDSLYKNRLLLFVPPDSGVDEAAIEAKPGFQRWYQMYVGCAGRAVIAGPRLPPGAMQAPALSFANSDAPIDVLVTLGMANGMLGVPLTGAKVGMTGRTVTTRLQFADQPRPGRNVVAVLPGSDPQLAGEYVAIGAHNDHLGPADAAVDHDSLKVFNEMARPQGADGGDTRMLSPAQSAALRVSIDSLHRLHGGPRADSIFNGADDDGSGTVSVLELAEAFAKGSVKPKRSILFIWHAGEEKGLWGSEYFTDHPTVPRDSIVAELNLDMVGRGQPSDVTGNTKDGAPIHGGPNYLQAIGSRRLSTELGDLAEQVDRDGKFGITFDYSLDADGHPENIYCRSDHAEYARYGIPIAFFTTGGHADYHQVTDEAQYIQYRHMALVDQFVFDLAERVANLDHRVKVDHPKPDPHGTCQQ
jgi:hypothetical protein